MSDEELREQAIKHIKDKRDFWMHLVAYVLVNGFLAIIWALSGGGYFWPVWCMVPWGIGLFFHGASVLLEGRPIREKDIQREMRHLGGSGASG